MKGISVSAGNMYDWVTHMWSQIVGCPHQCSYCYVANRFRDQPAEVTLKDFWPPLGSGRVYFVGHLCDMFAEAVPTDCRVFQARSSSPSSRSWTSTFTCSWHSW